MNTLPVIPLGQHGDSSVMLRAGIPNKEVRFSLVASLQLSGSMIAVTIIMYRRNTLEGATCAVGSAVVGLLVGRHLCTSSFVFGAWTKEDYGQ